MSDDVDFSGSLSELEVSFEFSVVQETKENKTKITIRVEIKTLTLILLNLTSTINKGKYFENI